MKSRNAADAAISGTRTPCPLSTADLIAALTLATIWLGSLAGVWWRVSLQVHSVRRALYEHRVEMARELGSRVTVEMFDERFNRFEERFLEELRELRQALLKQFAPPSGHHPK